MLIGEKNIQVTNKCNNQLNYLQCRRGYANLCKYNQRISIYWHKTRRQVCCADKSGINWLHDEIGNRGEIMRVGVHANNQKNTSTNKHLKTKLILSCCPQYIMLSYTFILFVLSNKDIVMEQVDYCVSSPHSPSKLVSLLSLSLLVFDYPQDSSHPLLHSPIWMRPTSSSLRGTIDSIGMRRRIRSTAWNSIVVTNG